MSIAWCLWHWHWGTSSTSGKKTDGLGSCSRVSLLKDKYTNNKRWFQVKVQSAEAVHIVFFHFTVFPLFTIVYYTTYDFWIVKAVIHSWRGRVCVPAANAIQTLHVLQCRFIMSTLVFFIFINLYLIKKMYNM